MKKHYTYGKTVRGPGGWNCRCCSVFLKPVAKKVNSRALRRANRQALRCLPAEAS